MEKLDTVLGFLSKRDNKLKSIRILRGELLRQNYNVDIKSDIRVESQYSLSNSIDHSEFPDKSPREFEHSPATINLDPVET